MHTHSYMAHPMPSTHSDISYSTSLHVHTRTSLTPRPPMCTLRHLLLHSPPHSCTLEHLLFRASTCTLEHLIFRASTGTLWHVLPHGLRTFYVHSAIFHPTPIHEHSNISHPAALHAHTIASFTSCPFVHTLTQRLEQDMLICLFSFFELVFCYVSQTDLKLTI